MQGKIFLEETNTLLILCKNFIVFNKWVWVASWYYMFLVSSNYMLWKCSYIGQEFNYTICWAFQLKVKVKVSVKPVIFAVYTSPRFTPFCSNTEKNVSKGFHCWFLGYELDWMGSISCLLADFGIGGDEFFGSFHQICNELFLFHNFYFECMKLQV